MKQRMGVIGASRPVKRSISIDGHRTSVSLEAAFWEALVGIAAREGQSVAAIVGAVDRDRGDCGLSTALRLTVLAWYRDRCDRGAELDRLAENADRPFVP
jgi:predicted DNA-binding ribbon-helix-helix protein